MKKETALVICPGRGTYNQPELGYLAKHHASGSKAVSDFLDEIDVKRESLDQVSISELDSSERFKASLHGTGDNASALIYACALADFKRIDPERFEIVAVTGNSMGWYLALACAGVLPGMAGFDLVNTMGEMMHTKGEGGQVIYPLVDENWQLDPELSKICDDVVASLNKQDDIEIYTSIALGGMRVFAGNSAGVKALLKTLPPQQDRYPFQLLHHSAFHSPILNHIPAMATSKLASDMFTAGGIPLIDGQGKIWQPGAYNTEDLYHYTLGHQLIKPYDFSSAIDVSLKEFAPDKVIVLGPGTTLAPPIAQELIKLNWLGLNSKSDFASMQEEDPFLLAMGVDAQREKVL